MDNLKHARNCAVYWYTQHQKMQKLKEYESKGWGDCAVKLYAAQTENAELRAQLEVQTTQFQDLSTKYLELRDTPWETEE